MNWKSESLALVFGMLVIFMIFGDAAVVDWVGNLDYAFGHQNFHRIAIGVVGFNTKALNFYEQVGFQREGVQRDGYYYEHRYHDFVMMSMLENEFQEKWKGK